MKIVAAKQLQHLSLTTGAALSDDFFMLAATEDARLAEDPEDDHSVLVTFAKGRYVLDDGVPFSVRSQAAVAVPEPGIVSLNYFGGVEFDEPAGDVILEAKVGEASGVPVYGRTVLNQVRAVCGRAYAVGTHRSVYRREQADRWSVIDAGTFDDDDMDCGFDAIDGFSESDLYAVGEGGEIWQYNGTKWRQREAGTNAHLHAVLCGGDGKVYAVGRGGTIVVGRTNRWTRVEGIARNLEFWSIEQLDGRIFLAANTALLFELSSAGQLELVQFGECPIPTTVHHLFRTQDSLYALGSKHLCRFDGRQWHSLLVLDGKRPGGRR